MFSPQNCKLQKQFHIQKKQRLVLDDGAAKIGWSEVSLSAEMRLLHKRKPFRIDSASIDFIRFWPPSVQSLAIEIVQRAGNALPPLLQNMGVDHRC